MTGYDYASFIRNTCQELQNEIGVVPVKGYVYRDGGILPPKWSTVLCHPEDKGKDDESTFTHPYRDI